MIADVIRPSDVVKTSASILEASLRYGGFQHIDVIFSERRDPHNQRSSNSPRRLSIEPVEEARELAIQPLRHNLVASAALDIRL